MYVFDIKINPADVIFYAGITSLILSAICFAIYLYKQQARSKYPVVTLCGSVRLGKKIWEDVAMYLNLHGYLVFTVNVWGMYEYLHTKEGKETKKLLDDIHKKKIERSNAVVVLTRNGYIGDSTRSEIRHAKKHFIPVTYLDVDKWREKAIMHSSEGNPIDPSSFFEAMTSKPPKTYANHFYTHYTHLPLEVWRSAC